MKCPVCELFGHELRFETRRLLDQHSLRFTDSQSLSLKIAIGLFRWNRFSHQTQLI